MIDDDLADVIHECKRREARPRPVDSADDLERVILEQASELVEFHTARRRSLREELARSIRDEATMRETLTAAQASATEWRARALAAETRIRELETMHAK